jgi:phytol kinase
MFLEGAFPNDLVQDIVATAVTFALALGWLRLMDAVAARGLIESRASRKIIHIGTGPLFVLCWLLFSPASTARFMAALVPLAITVQFAIVGIGWMRDDEAVKAMTRHNDRREILRGPLFYGIVFIVCTLVFWRADPVGIVALMILCGGDGLADLVGRRFGRRRLPHNPGKSWIGSGAMFLGGYLLALLMVAVFETSGALVPGVDLTAAAASIGWIALSSAVVESLPLTDVDNLTISATAIVLGLALL